MKIGILGIRGVPNYHGGFEQFTEHLSEYLAKKGHQVYVYNSHNHPYQKSIWSGVNIIHKYDPEFKIGTAGQFIYDLNCIIDSRNKNYDIILQLGYTSNSIWFKFLPKKPIIITNMDGLEWKRSKYSKLVQKFLKKAEKWAVKSSNFLVSDSIGIQNYLLKKYNRTSTYIAYGASIFKNEDQSILKQYKVKEYNYSMLIARMEPENNIETILDGVTSSSNNQKFLVIGKNNINKFGKRLTEKYRNNNNILFLGGIYNQNHLNNLRFFSNLYFHGHSVGGTNPSLLEAMASRALIIAHNNIFNKAILQENGLYFSNKEDIKYFLDNTSKKTHKIKLDANYKKIISQFSKQKINKDYLSLFKMAISVKNNEK